MNQLTGPALKGLWSEAESLRPYGLEGDGGQIITSQGSYHFRHVSSPGAQSLLGLTQHQVS